jgi:L-ascorbate metabolism protein UlaG (beta-lactamase superfamily)
MNTVITWHGHAGFSIKNGIEIIIDPFINGNPLAREKLEDLKADLILVTHGHFDHAGDAAKLAKITGSPILCSFELSEILKKEDVETIDINPGGTVEFKGINVTAVPAIHSSSYKGLYAGASMGYIIENKEIKIYHAGDTTLFRDMELINSMYHPDLAMVPIGGHYTMDVDGSIEALKMLHPKIAIPMHYNTFPAIRANPSDFKKKAEKLGINAMVPEIGKAFTV